MPKSKKPRKTTTPLQKRKFEKGIIKSPFSPLKDLGGLHWSSWLDDQLPNVLWATLIIGNTERENALQIFRDITSCAAVILKDMQEPFLHHNYLSSLSYDDFSEIFAPLLNNEEILKACSSLTLVESLPDYQHWINFFSELSLQPCAEDLARGVASCLDHQSQEATDVRWMKVLFVVKLGKVQAPNKFLESVSRYPYEGDMRSVRPAIRAFEMATRTFESESQNKGDIPAAKSSEFWEEMLKKSPCSIIERKPLIFEDTAVTRDSIRGCIDALCNHFMQCITSTKVDARLDGAFGLAINMLTLTLELSVSPSNNFATGRIVLRTLVENFITLMYLSEKDDLSIWLQYRNYGSGQTALAFLKNVYNENAPDFIDLERLEAIANEDAWIETKDIAIGNWAKLDLRRMASESGIKDVYDAYYDWTSGFVHGHWGAVRDSAFTICMNPLHRLHRVPAPGSHMPTVLVDCCKLCNRALDEVEKLYPSFKPRIDWKSDAARK